MISESPLASPGGSAPFQCHCSQRPLLTSEPSSSAKQVDGRRNTSVWIFAESTSLYGPKFFQNSEVSVASGSMITRYLSLDRLSTSLALFGNEAIGLKPWHTYPLTLPLCMSSNTCRTSCGLSSLGSQSKHQLFSFVAAFPNHAFIRLTWNFG